MAFQTTRFMWGISSNSWSAEETETHFPYMSTRAQATKGLETSECLVTWPWMAARHLRAGRKTKASTAGARERWRPGGGPDSCERPTSCLKYS